MGTIRGFILDSSLKKIAKNMIEMEKTGVVIDVNTTVKNWNEQHKLVKPEEVANLQSDISLFIEVEKKRKLRSMSARGYSNYLAEPYVEKAKELMAPPSFDKPQED